MIHQLVTATILCLLFSPLAASAQTATTFYVNRADPACGGQAPCFRSIQSAIDAAQPRTTIRIQAGTYSEQLEIKEKNDFNSASELDRIVIEADPANAPGSVVLTGSAGAQCTDKWAIRVRESKFITIRDLTITGTGAQAIVLMGGSNQNRGIHIELNRIFANGSSSCDGGINIRRGNPDTLIVNNLLYGNGRNAISITDESGGPHYIINNTIANNSWNGVDVARGHVATVANNIIVNNGTAPGTTGGRFGIRRESSSNPQPGGIKLLNNLICGNGQAQISSQILDSTDASNYTQLGSEGQGVSALPGCELQANLFANRDGLDGQPNTADDDFSLKANSLAVDVGMDPRTLGFNPSYNPIFEADFVVEGIRPADGNADRAPAFDAGAFEYPNAPPTANAGADQSVSAGELVTLSGTQSSDPEGAVLSYQWTIASQPAGSTIVLGSATTATPSFTPLVVGQYTLSLVVNDGQFNSAPATVVITAVAANRAPSANAGGPYSGIVGVPVQFSGTGSDPDNDPLTFSWNFGDGSAPLTTGGGSASSPVYTYAAPGAYAVTLTVRDPSNAAGTAQTTATINPAGVILNPIGNKTVQLGQTLTFTVSASHPAGAPVNLYVAPLPLMQHASFNASTGVFTFRPGTTQVGSYQLTFSAVSGGSAASETITISVPNPPPGGTTAVRGRVVNLAQTPLSNVIVTLKNSGHTGVTGADGVFTINGVPSGTQQLIVNGRQANLGVYAIIAVAVDLIDGVLNNLSGDISLPDVDVDAEVQVSPTFNTIVANPNVPGVELEIIGGSATNADGTPFTGKLSINPVPDYGRPESRPEELRPGFAITIQPAGIRFNPPARLIFPNADGMATNNDLNLWSLSPDTGKFNLVGKGTVSADGQTVITTEGGVTASAWHFFLPTATTANPSQGDSFCGSCRTAVGSEANLEEGSLFIMHELPSYRSLGQSRALSLTYSSLTADPRPIIALDSTLSFRAAVPNTLSTRLKVGGVQQGNEVFINSTSLPENADSTTRIAVQFDAANLPTGRYPFEATVFSNYLNSSVGGISTGNVIVVNRSNSSLGAGWTITDLQQLHSQADGGVLLTSGDGTALFFAGGPDAFSSPAREFSTLARNPDGTYTRTYKDGTKIYFTAQGLQSSVVDRNLNTTTFGYDGSGRLTSVSDPVGLVTSLSYSDAKLQSISDPAGRATQFQYDAAGNLTRITNPDSTFKTFAYDSKNHITQATDERGLATSYAYDFGGRFALSTRPTGETRALVSARLRGLVDTAGGQGTPTNPGPITTSANANASLSDGRGSQSRFTLDPLGQVTSQSDALGQTTTTVRDSNGLPTRITRPNGAVSTMTYDPQGNLLSTTNAIGATTVFTYDPTFNQVKTIRDPKGNLTTINYDTRGNPIEIVDALNQRTQMTYDWRGLLLSVTAAVGTAVQTSTSFTYDSRGNLLTSTDPRNNITTLAYDAAGNVSRSTDADNRVTQFTYDPRNRLLSVLDADAKTTHYSYDPKGNLAQVRDAKNQTTTFQYDGLDRLAAAINPLGLAETFTYDGNGNLTSTTNRNGQTIAFNYDALNRLISKTRPPTSLESENYTTTFNYDPVGNLTSVTNPVTNVIHQYDLANRLVSSTSAPESTLASSVIQINSDTTIAANNNQFEGQSLQVNGRTLTVDGTHTFANLTLINGAVLRHSPTTGSVAGKLDVVVSGILQVDATSRIDASGLGFLAAGRPGNPLPSNGMTSGFQPGSGPLSGGSYGGVGGSGGASVANPVHGDFRNPNEPGSGGGAVGSPGGNGGGLLRIVAQTLVLNGSIRSNGGPVEPSGSASGGSGGAIRIDVGEISGTGTISANGTPGAGAIGGGGSGGRIAIYYQRAAGFNFANLSAFGSTGPGATNAGAGTIYLQGPARDAGELIVDNNNVATPSLATPILGASTTSLALTHMRVRRGAKAKLESALNLTGSLEISNGGEFAAGNRVAGNDVSVNSNGILTHLATTASAFFKLDLSAQTLAIDSTSRIDASGLGFLAAGRPGNPFPNDGMTQGFQRGSGSLSGGSYGGSGGSGGSSVAVAVYGNFRNPNEPGSGGGAVGAPGGNGGGLIRIVAQTLTLDGAIRANGGGAEPFGSASGGSGGAIRIDVGTITGSGSIRANGTPGAGTIGGGGSGGRIAIYYQNATGFSFANLSAFGSIGPNATNAGAGTLYLQGPTRENGELIVDNNGVATPSMSTPIPLVSGAVNLTHLRVKRQGRVRVDNLLNLTGALELNTQGEFISSNRVIAARIDLLNNSSIGQPATTATAAYKVELSANAMTVDATSSVSAFGKGFLGGEQPGNPFGGVGMTLGFVQGSTGSAGGSHGGLGGPGIGTANPLYGSAQDPQSPGSGGASLLRIGGNGGGVIRIAAGTLALEGTLNANGGSGVGDIFAGGGSGGAIRLDVGALSGTGQITARGGNGQSTSGAGGGGRIAIYYANAAAFNFAGQVVVTSGTVGGAPNGQNGTLHLQQQMAMNGPASLEPAAVMIAQIEATENSEVRDQTPATPENRYLAMVAQGRLTPFATTAMKTQGSSASSVVASDSDNPKSKIGNPKSSADLLTPNSSLLTVDDLDPIYTYDLNGNRTSMIDPTGLTTYQYDPLNRLTAITNNKGQTTTFAYDALGRRTSMTHANGVATTYSYDAASQLTRLAHQLGATNINAFDYVYDRVGNRASKTSRDGAHNYTYDVLNRLTQAVNPLPTNPLETFNYDPAGNRTGSNQNGASVFNTANQLLEDANFTYQYDNNGNQTRKTAKVGGAVTLYEYDAENKLVRVVSPVNTAAYRYDGLGRRVEKEVIAATTTVTKYVYDNEDILLELDGTNQIVARYTHGPGIDEPLIMEKSGQPFFYHADGLGSITELTSQAGTVAQRYTYSSFGKIESVLDAGFVQPYAYTSREWDGEGGLYYYRARSYDSDIGRFLQEDPAGLLAGPNFYTYVGNNPVYFVDPLGLDALSGAANYAAGFGDMLTFGITGYVRRGLGVDKVVDKCSIAYSAGWWTGMLHQIAFTGVGAFNGGTRSVFYSGEGALETARAGKGAGRLLEDTLGGQLLKFVDRRILTVPDNLWKTASGIFAANAKGEATVFLRNPNASSIYNAVEAPVLRAVNSINSFLGSRGAAIVMR